MSALDIIVPGADALGKTFSGYLALPVMRGVIGIYLLDGTRDGTVDAPTALTNASKNRVRGGTDATVIGTPTTNARSTSLTNNLAYLQTVHPETDNMSMLVSNLGNYKAGNYVSNSQSPRAAGGALKSNGIGMYTNAASEANGNSYAAAVSQYDGVLTTASAVMQAAGLYNPDDAAWMAWSLRVSESVAGGGAGSVGTITRDLLTVGTRNSTTRAAGQVRDKAAGTLRIGSGYINDGRADQITAGLVIIANVTWTDAELAANYAWLKKFSAGWHGVQV